MKLESQSFEAIMQVIEGFAQNIAAEVAEKRFYEIAEIKAIATTRLRVAVAEIIEMQKIGLEDVLLRLRQQYVDSSLPGKRRSDIGMEISVLKEKHKNINRALSCFRDYDEYEQLKHYLRDRFGPDLLKDFWDNYLNKGQNALNITKRAITPTEVNTRLEQNDKECP